MARLNNIIALALKRLGLPRGTGTSIGEYNPDTDLIYDYPAKTLTIREIQNGVTLDTVIEYESWGPPKIIKKIYAQVVTDVTPATIED